MRAGAVLVALAALALGVACARASRPPATPGAEATRTADALSTAATASTITAEPTVEVAGVQATAPAATSRNPARGRSTATATTATSVTSVVRSAPTGTQSPPSARGRAQGTQTPAASARSQAPIVVIFPTPQPTPTATPVAALPLRIQVELEPAQPHAGEDFLLLLRITNAGGRMARGVYIATSGPWDRFNVLDIQPTGRLSRDAAGWYILSPLRLAPGATETLQVRARADSPSDDRMTFAVREADPEEWALMPAR